MVYARIETIGSEYHAQYSTPFVDHGGTIRVSQRSELHAGQGCGILTINLMQRREFLKFGAAVAAAPALGSAQTGAAPKAKMTSSVMLWTLKGTFDEKLEAAARAGMQSVELVGEYAGWN